MLPASAEVRRSRLLGLHGIQTYQTHQGAHENRDRSRFCFAIHRMVPSCARALVSVLAADIRLRSKCPITRVEDHLRLAYLLALLQYSLRSTSRRPWIPDKRAAPSSGGMIQPAPDSRMVCAISQSGFTEAITGHPAAK